MKRETMRGRVARPTTLGFCVRCEDRAVHEHRDPREGTALAVCHGCGHTRDLAVTP